MQDMLAVFDQYKDREREVDPCFFFFFGIYLCVHFVLIGCRMCQQVAVWAALQMLLNPLLESLLLLDRLLYIEEFKSTYVTARTRRTH